MIPPPSPRTPARAAARAATAGATALYVANCGLGTAVGLRLVDTSRAHWVHHALYGAVLVAAGGAVAGAVATRSRAGLALAPALLPLLALPRVPAPSRGHVALAAAAAPCYLMALRGTVRERAAERGATPRALTPRALTPRSRRR